MDSSSANYYSLSRRYSDLSWRNSDLVRGFSDSRRSIILSALLIAWLNSIIDSRCVLLRRSHSKCINSNVAQNNSSINSGCSLCSRKTVFITLSHPLLRCSEPLLRLRYLFPLVQLQVKYQKIGDVQSGDGEGVVDCTCFYLSEVFSVVSHEEE